MPVAFKTKRTKPVKYGPERDLTRFIPGTSIPAFKPRIGNINTQIESTPKVATHEIGALKKSGHDLRFAAKKRTSTSVLITTRFASESTELHSHLVNPKAIFVKAISFFSPDDLLDFYRLNLRKKTNLQYGVVSIINMRGNEMGRVIMHIPKKFHSRMKSLFVRKNFIADVNKISKEIRVFGKTKNISIGKQNNFNVKKTLQLIELFENNGIEFRRVAMPGFYFDLNTNLFKKENLLYKVFKFFKLK